jgi:hypothetical protein
MESWRSRLASIYHHLRRPVGELCLVTYRGLMGNIDRVAEGAVLLTVLFAILVPVTDRMATSEGHLIQDVTHSRRRSDGLVIADAIRSAGVNAGDYVAVVGSGYAAISSARLAGVRIVAEIRDESAFWNLSENELREVRHRLAGIHVKALLTATSTQRLDDRAWSEVKGLKYSHFRISPLRKTP